MFANPTDAKNLRWHADERKCDGLVRHRRFLNPFHPYCRLKKTFNGHQEHDIAPIPLTGAQVYEKVKGLHVDFGKKER